MLDRLEEPEHSILIMDRGYEPYQMAASLQARNPPFVLRVKKPSSNHCFSYVSKASPTYCFQPMRVIRCTGSPQAQGPVYLLTNLPEEDFSFTEIKEWYRLRWGIETSFRELKYALSLLHFHSKKMDLILQEIYAKLTMYLAWLSTHLFRAQKRHIDFKSFHMS